MLNHFIDIKQLNKTQIQQLIKTATDFLHQTNDKPIHSHLKIANLFFEPSTRTLLSFQVAAQRLGIFCLSPEMKNSSLSKGESFLDMIQNIAAMGVNLFIIRHQENKIMHWLAERMPTDCYLINAGEGWLQHPSQGLLDLMTLQHYFPNWEKLRIAIIGDLRHSRVARSLIDGLKIMGVNDIRLIAPQVLQPEEDVLQGTQTITDIDEGVVGVDAIVCLRLQKERMTKTLLINETEFYEQYGLSQTRLKKAQSNAIVLHPGPINRNIEIASEVADGKQSVILQQVANGVAMRMAILSQFY